ncbi:PCC domain-containing protein [Rhizobium halophytocola]|uniref:DNA-binding protein with PD1-like motif n=1 Tax=Rhizobium halophytocola TaxID=735519 RepID=A0ABS4DVI6_9HYPH|nr:DUF296 domain-containing protein [Rhizobium halophytocola]MBP1849649.1 putative DNA-binding protein with PD1-like motif [Rhizobium halophytocola]
MSMRTIRHPGPIDTERYRVQPCGVEPLQLTVSARRPLGAAIAEAFACEGYRFGYAHMASVPMVRLDYVIPAGSPDATHAAWYSETHRPPHGGVIEAAGLHLGERDDEPFLHGHGLWRIPQQGTRMGHLLPAEARLLEPVEITALGIAGAGLVARDDAETNFRLFSPEVFVDERHDSLSRALLATIKPNVDLCETIEIICRQAGFAAAIVHGIGSLVGVDYADGRHVPSYATEVLIRRGRVVTVDGAPVATLDIAVVDMNGDWTKGELKRGANPVCVTFELLIVEMRGGQAAAGV